MPYVLLVAAFFWTYKCVRFLHKNERGVVLRLGRIEGDCLAPLGPGFVLIFWPIDTLVRWKVVVGNENLLGKEGVWGGRLTKEQFGIVKIDGRDWGAVADHEIPLGQNVSVVGMEGINLLVEVGPNAKSPETLLDEEIARKLEWVKLLDDEKRGPHRGDLATEHFELAKLYERKGDSEAASRHYRVAEELRPNIRESSENEQGTPS